MNDRPTTAAIRQQQEAYALEQMRKDSSDILSKCYGRLASLIITRPEELAYHSDHGQDGKVAFVVYPPAEDAAKLIGARGVMFHSFRSVLQQIAGKHGLKVHYTLETANRELPKTTATPFVSRPDWPEAKLREAFEETCEAMFDYPHTIKWENIRDRTQVSITLSPDEPVRIPDPELKDAIGKIIHACGRANGRMIYIESMERSAT